MCHAHVCGIDFCPPRLISRQGRPPRLCTFNLWTNQRIVRFQFYSNSAIRENSSLSFLYVSIWGIHPWPDSSTVELRLGGLTSGRTCRLLYLERNLLLFWAANIGNSYFDFFRLDFTTVELSSLVPNLAVVHDCHGITIRQTLNIGSTIRRTHDIGNYLHL